MLKHVEEIRIATGIQLIGAVDGHAAVAEQTRQLAVNDGRADLAFDVVADDRHTGLAEAVRPIGVRGDEYRHAVDHGDTRVEACLGVMLDRLFRAHGQIADKNLRPGIAKRLGDVFRFLIGGAECAVVFVVAHMVGDAVQHRPHTDHDVRYGQSPLKHRRAVGFFEDRLFHGQADLAAVDIEGADDLNVRRTPATHVRMHQPRVFVAVTPSIEFQPLDQ